jgi:MFS family permease
VGSGLHAALWGAVLFGVTASGIVNLVLTMAGRYYPTRPAKMMGKMTLSYGVAQVVAPAVTGLMAVHLGGYRAGLYLAAAAMAVATLLLFMLRAVEARTRGHPSLIGSELATCSNPSLHRKS